MKSILIINVLFLFCSNIIKAQEYKPNLPWIDISFQKEKQIVVAEGTDSLYNGHPTTVMTPDNKIIYCTWSYDHGGKAGLMAKSADGGNTWEQMQTPKDWGKTSNCPSIYRLIDKNRTERLFVFTANPNMSQCYSEDQGKTWSPVKSLNKPCVMAFTSIIRLNNGDYLGMYHRGYNDEDRPPLTLWQSISKDGGLTWGKSTKVGELDGYAPCEPYLFRDPSNKRIICIARENLRKGHSLMMYSDNEGKTWSNLTETCWGLTGDRHIIKYTSDGRLIAVFRDMAPNSPTKGHFIAWVGTYNDLINKYSGQYRIKLLHSFAGADCGYPGLEILPDGTILAITYIKYRPGQKKHSIVAVKFNIEEIDKGF